MGRSVVGAMLGGACCLSLAVSACSDGAVNRDPGSYPGGSAGSGGSSPNGGSGNVGGTDLGQAGATSVPAGQGVGEACSDSEPCRDGLKCGADDKCAPAGDKAAGDACVLSAECADGQCVGRQCAPAGAGMPGEGCLSDADCGAGLRCAIVGLSLSCTPEGSG